MKRVQIVATCDVTSAETGTVVPADETLYIALGPDPDNLRVRELDLTGDWAAELRERLRVFLDAGHDPGEVLAPGGPAARRGRGGAHDQAALRYNRAMRAWCDETGFEPRYAILPKGGYRYPKALREAYAAHLAGDAA